MASVIVSSDRGGASVTTVGPCIAAQSCAASKIDACSFTDSEIHADMISHSFGVVKQLFPFAEETVHPHK